MDCNFAKPGLSPESSFQYQDLPEIGSARVLFRDRFRFIFKMPMEKIHHPVRRNFPDVRWRPGHYRPGDGEIPPLHVEFDRSFLPSFEYQTGTPDDMHPVTGRAPFRVGPKGQRLGNHLVSCMIEIDAEYTLSEDKTNPVKTAGFLGVFCLLKGPPRRADIDKRVALFSRGRNIRRFGQLGVPLFILPDDPAVEPVSSSGIFPYWTFIAGYTPDG